MDEESKYSYSTEELDAILRKMEKGITPIIPDDMMKEVLLRKRELELLRTGDDENLEEYLSEVEKHKKLTRALKEREHKATKTEAYVYTMTPEQLKEIEEDMTTTFVRENPNSPYNRSSFDSEMSEEKREILIKLSKLRNCYYNQKDYQEAIETIRKAIEISLKTDYPWLSPEEAIRKFKNKEIVYSFGALPKIYLNYITPVTDPETAKKIASGEITLVDKNENRPKKRRRKSKEGVTVEVRPVCKQEVEDERKMFNAGYDSSIAPMLKGSVNAYGRFDMPNSGYFHDDIDSPYEREKEDMLSDFDWLQEDAAEKYYNLLNNIDDRMSVYDLLKDIQKTQNIDINPAVGNNMTDFLNSYSLGSSEYDNATYTTSRDYARSIIQPNQKALEIEEQLLENIRNSNP